MGNNLNLSPIFIISSLAMWGMVWGVPAMFLASSGIGDYHHYPVPIPQYAPDGYFNVENRCFARSLEVVHILNQIPHNVCIFISKHYILCLVPAFFRDKIQNPACITGLPSGQKLLVIVKPLVTGKVI